MANHEKHEKHEKHVSFNTGKNTTHFMIVWSFAYKSARKSNWLQIRADTDRFERRCNAIGTNISYVFGDDHRKVRKHYIDRNIEENGPTV